MQQLVEKIIQNSKATNLELTPKQLFYRAFDQSLNSASASNPLSIAASVEKIERMGQKAGISAAEIAYRKKTILWNHSQLTH